MLTHTPRLRFSGHGEQLRLRQRGDWQHDPLAAVRECCRASMAIDKALGEAVREAVAAGVSWQEVGRTLGVTDHGQNEQAVIEAFADTKRMVWHRFWSAS